jgi:hypothetical protein
VTCFRSSGVSVGAQTAVIEELRESHALVARVGDAVGDRRVVAHRRGFRIAPREEGIDDVAGALVAEREGSRRSITAGRSGVTKQPIASYRRNALALPSKKEHGPI